MTFSAVVRFLIATFDWLKSEAWPLLLCAWRNCKIVAQTCKEKLQVRPWSDLRFPRFPFPQLDLMLVLVWLRNTVATCLLWGLSISAFVCFWFWAWTP